MFPPDKWQNLKSFLFTVVLPKGACSTFRPQQDGRLFQHLLPSLQIKKPGHHLLFPEATRGPQKVEEVGRNPWQPIQSSKGGLWIHKMKQWLHLLPAVSGFFPLITMFWRKLLIFLESIHFLATRKICFDITFFKRRGEKTSLSTLTEISKHL